MALRFAGEVALVTSGSTGLGRAAALAFAREGARVVVSSRRADEPEEVADAVVRLCAKGASLTTGHTLPVDGSYLA